MSIVLTVALIAVALGLGACIGWFAHSPQPRAHPGTQPGTQPGPAAAQLPIPPAAPAPPAQDARLIGALIGVHDLGDGVAIRPQIREDLGQVGVHLLAAELGAPFDSARHKAVHSVVAADPEQVGTVAELVRPGWTGPAGIIRFPEVTVFAAPASA